MASIRNASRSSDSTWEGTFIALWKVLEVTFGVKCGCLPAVKPLIQKFLPRTGTGSGHSKTAGLGSNSFNRLDNGISRSHIKSDRDVDLQDLRRPSVPDGAIEVTSETIVRTRRKADSDSEEWMFTDEDGKGVSS